MSAIVDTELRSLWRGCWAGLPALTVMSAVVCLATLVTMLAAPGVNAVSIAVAVLVVGPAVAGLVGTVTTIADEDGATVAGALRTLRDRAGSGIKVMVVPGAGAELFLAAWQLWSQHRSALLLPSLGLTGAATVLSAVLGVVVLADGRGWRDAAALVAARPGRFLAVAVLAALGLWAVLAVSVVLLPLVPAPVCVVLVAAVRTTGAHDPVR